MLGKVSFQMNLIDNLSNVAVSYNNNFLFHKLKQKFSVVKFFSEKHTLIGKRSSEETDELEVNNSTRYSDLKIQMLSKPLFDQIFKDYVDDRHSANDLKKCISHLHKNGLWGKETSCMKDVSFKLPLLKGKNLDEHFRIIGEMQSSAYKKLLSTLINIRIPLLPKTWSFIPGWTMYNEYGEPKPVDHPECGALVFDIEVCMSEGQHPTLACAMSDKCWYSWCSTSLIDPNKKELSITIDDLIPLRGASNDDTPKVIVGHNVSFDRKAVKEEYLISDSKIRFVDTMSMHIAVSGFVEEQRGIVLKNEKAEQKIKLPWMFVGSTNSLKDVVKFYCKEELLKESREIFVKGTLDDVREHFQDLVQYCAEDVKATHKVLNKLLPLFFERFPHPITFAGMLEMSTAYLPVSEDWMKYISCAEKEFDHLNGILNEELIEQTKKALNLRDGKKYEQDPWLWDLDWMVPKGRVKVLKDYPNWYRKLCKKTASGYEIPKPENMSTSLRVVPKLLRLTWKGYPLHFDKIGGWGFIKPVEHVRIDDGNYESEVKFPLKTLLSICKERETTDCDNDYDVEPGLDIGIPNVLYYPLPHKNGEGNRVGNPLAKDFLKKLEDKTLSSSVPNVAALVLKITKSISYWKNNRDRILSQTVIWLMPDNLSKIVTDSAEYMPDTKCGAILPQVVTAGTITRRAVERTWMTASNAYEDRIGSELKAMIKAPPGYHFVGADVDSQELWIASILGDAYFGGEHGSTALGWMTLQGNKANGTDMHSRTAATAGISRNNAKIINYGRIYGAGLKFMQRLLKQFNQNLSDNETRERATKLFAETKGEKGWYLNKEGEELATELDFVYKKQPLTRKEINHLLRSSRLSNYDVSKEDIVEPVPVWVGGSESHMFNCLESIARSNNPRTPVLGARITRSLEPWCVGDSFMTSRINWVVQSSAVDFLHLMLVCMKWLLTEYKISGRFSISIHDEVRYLIASDDRYRAALALHITNLLVRSYISMRVGLRDLPQSVGFFEGVDIDKVLRKEPDMDCVTPSNPEGLQRGYRISKGETLNIHQVIEKTKGLLQPGIS